MERLERDRGVVALAAAPGRAAIEQLGARQGDHQDRQLRPRLHHVLDEIEQRVARPVKVFEDDHHRPGRSRRLHRAAPGVEHADAIGLRHFCGADGRGEQLGGVRGIGDAALGEPIGEAPLQVLDRRIARHTDEPVQHRAQRPERQPLAVRQTLRDSDERCRRPGIPRQPGEEFLHEPRLARPGRRDDTDELRPALGERSACRELQLLEVGVAADHRQRRCGRVGGRLRHGPSERIAVHLQRFAAQLQWARRVECEATPGRAGGAF